MNKKGFTVSDILPLAIVLVVAVIGIGIGADIVDDVRTSQEADAYGCASDRTNCSWAYNVSGSGLAGLDTFGDYIPTIALVVIAAIIIGILVMYLART